MGVIMKLLVRTLAIGVTGYLVPGVFIKDPLAAVVAVIVLGVLNSFLRPILLILTIPVNILTLGLFTLVINTAMVLLAAQLVPGFGVSGFWTALVFSIVLSVVNWFLDSLGRSR